MPAFGPAGWPAATVLGRATRATSAWEGVERAMGARNYGRQTVGGCASRGRGSAPERDGPWKIAAREVENAYPAHAFANARTLAEIASLKAATSFDLYGDKENG